MGTTLWGIVATHTSEDRTLAIAGIDTTRLKNISSVDKREPARELKTI